MINMKRNKVKMCLKGGPKNRKMSPTTKTVNCHSLTYLWYWWRVDNKIQYLSFLVLNLRRYLFTNYTGGRSIQWARGRGGKNLSHLYSSINYRCFHASSSQTLITWLLASWILYFGLLRGVMKIRFAVTLAVLGY